MLLVLRAAGAGDVPAARLELAAEPPVVQVVPVSAAAPGRQFIQLPTLEYRFAVHAACGAERTPRSLSVSIADSRVTLSGTALQDRPADELVLTVPARQLAPVAVDDFCIAGDDSPAVGGTAGLQPATSDPQPPRRLTVPAVVSVQASLVCGGESGADIRYVTQPLAVTLACAAPTPAAAPESSGNSPLVVRPANGLHESRADRRQD